jgi:tRNA (guanine37-N1)-methyltransferase
MRFDIFTLFPAMFASPFAESMTRRAIDAGLIEIHTHNIRDYAAGKHKVTDDLAYGGGGGMVMKPEPIFAAVETVLGMRDEGRGMSESAPIPHPSSLIPNIPVILMSPAGRRFSHAIAKELAAHERIALICGHYEGVDDRVRQHLCTDEISIGDFVLTGGELPAMVIVDAVSRLVPGMLPPGTPENESHASGLLEYPHYTRPADFRGHKVPDILLSGDHAKIEKWRSEQAEMRTRARLQSGEQEIGD